jgi:hypothetical protein
VTLETPGARGWVVGAGAFCAFATRTRPMEKAAHNNVSFIFAIIYFLS